MMQDSKKGFLPLGLELFFSESMYLDIRGEKYAFVISNLMYAMLKYLLDQIFALLWE